MTKFNSFYLSYSKSVKGALLASGLAMGLGAAVPLAAVDTVIGGDGQQGETGAKGTGGAGGLGGNGAYVMGGSVITLAGEGENGDDGGQGGRGGQGGDGGTGTFVIQHTVQNYGDLLIGGYQGSMGPFTAVDGFDGGAGGAGSDIYDTPAAAGEAGEAPGGMGGAGGMFGTIPNGTNGSPGTLGGGGGGGGSGFDPFSFSGFSNGGNGGAGADGAGGTGDDGGQGAAGLDQIDTTTGSVVIGSGDSYQVGGNGGIGGVGGNGGDGGGGGGGGGGISIDFSPPIPAASGGMAGDGGNQGSPGDGGAGGVGIVEIQAGGLLVNENGGNIRLGPASGEDAAGNSQLFLNGGTLRLEAGSMMTIDAPTNGPMDEASLDLAAGVLDIESGADLVLPVWVELLGAMNSIDADVQNDGTFAMEQNNRFNGLVSGEGTFDQRGNGVFDYRGNISPGNSIGTLTLEGDNGSELNHVLDSNLIMELDSPSSHDILLVDNTLLEIVFGAGLKVIANGPLSLGDSFDLVQTVNGGTIQDSFIAALPGVLDVSMTPYPDPTFWELTQSSSLISLQLIQVPEPSTYALLGMALGMTSFARRRRVEA